MTRLKRVLKEKFGGEWTMIIRFHTSLQLYAKDFDQYKYEERGVYYEMEELPFPYAKNNDELESNVRAFDEADYLKKWDAFTVRMGLNETGHAARDFAEKVVAGGETSQMSIYQGLTCACSHYSEDTVVLIRNLLGTINIMELARAKQTERVIFASTREVYGEQKGC